MRKILLKCLFTHTFQRAIRGKNSKYCQTTVEKVVQSSKGIKNVYMPLIIIWIIPIKRTTNVFGDTPLFLNLNF